MVPSVLFFDLRAGIKISGIQMDLSFVFIKFIIIPSGIKKFAQ